MGVRAKWLRLWDFQPGVVVAISRRREVAMNLLSNIWVILWLVLGVGVAALAFYRRMVTSHEDDIVHVTSGQTRAVADQANFAQKVEKIDFWGKTLTVVLVVYGMVLGAWILYQLWIQSARVTE